MLYRHNSGQLATILTNVSPLRFRAYAAWQPCQDDLSVHPLLDGPNVLHASEPTSLVNYLVQEKASKATKKSFLGTNKFISHPMKGLYKRRGLGIIAKLLTNR